MGTSIGFLRGIGSALLDFAYPPRCQVCEVSVEGRSLLCVLCWAEIMANNSRLWSCGRQLEYALEDKELQTFKKIVFWGEFTGSLKEAIYAFKYQCHFLKDWSCG